MEGTFSNESIEEKNPTNKGGKVYIIILRSVLSKFVMLVKKQSGFYLTNISLYSDRTTAKDPFYAERCSSISGEVSLKETYE